MLFRSKIWLSLLVVLTGCAVDTNRDELAGHCYFLTASDGKEYCGTTMIEVIAQPRMFDDQLVTIRGWVIREGDAMMMFPFPEYAERGFSDSSILVSGDAVDELKDTLPTSSIGVAPQRTTMSGRFISLRGKQTSSDVPRLGLLEGVDRAMP